MKIILGFSFYFFIATSWAQQTPELLGERWVSIIKEHSVKKLEPLIHPNCPKHLISTEILDRMAAGELPPQYIIEKNELGPKNLLEKFYWVTPEMQLNLRYITQTAEEKKKYGIGKGFPIARHEGRWYFVICTKVNR